MQRGLPCHLQGGERSRGIERSPEDLVLVQYQGAVADGEQRDDQVSHRRVLRRRPALGSETDAGWSARASVG